MKKQIFSLIFLEILMLTGLAWSQTATTIWFKSPWGNKTIPNIVMGTETAQMSIPEGPENCGWFYYTYTETSAFMPVHFTRPQSTNTYPATGTIDVGVFYTTNTTGFIDGLNPTANISATQGTAGECFDKNYTIHFYWEQTGTPSVSAGTAIPSGTMKRDARLPNWYFYDARSIGTGLETLLISISTRTGNRTTVTEYNELFQPSLSSLFPEGIYDVWLVPTENGRFSISYSAVTNKVVRIMSPWSNTSPTLVHGTVSTPMTSVENYCGWFQAVLKSSETNIAVSFKQTIGTEVYTQSGLVDGFPIALDSIFTLSDTVWVLPTPHPSGTPILFSRYPNILGVCPVKNLAVMMLDWYDGSTERGRNGFENRGVPRFGVGVNEDFGNGDCSGTPGDDGVTKGMVERILGPNGVPVRSATFPEESCTNAKYLDYWFIPTVIAQSNGVDYVNAVCKDLELELDAEGLWYAQIDDSSPGGGFFVLDDFRYLDAAGTVENVHYDSALGNGGYHNFGFTMKAVAEFEYVPGQYFEFNGDDDVWVFINKQLVVDIGGQHTKKFSSVNLDTLGLIPGKTYPFHIFYAERKVSQSNFMMRTSMNLRTERSYYPIDISTNPAVIQYQIWQITREQSLSCDFSGMTAKDTALAPSNFTLYGGNLPPEGVALQEGLNYGGITIDQGFTGFTVDTNAIHSNRSLPPGSYRLVFSMRGDGSLSGEVWFTVSEYPRPSIAFANDLWQVISPDTSEIGEWANKMYPVYVRVLEESCDNCDNTLFLSSSNQNLIFMDALGNTISSVNLVGGHAVFYIFATQAVEDAAIQVSNTVFANSLVWLDIDLALPPVPQLEFGEMHDRDGDGIADSLFLTYTKSLSGIDFPDSVLWSFGDTTKNALNKNQLQGLLTGDRSFVLTSNTGFTKNFFTGMPKEPYFGLATTWFTFVPDNSLEKILFDVSGQIADKVGPILLAASVSEKTGGITSLSLTFSEALQDGDEKLFATLFEYKYWREGILKPSIMAPVSGAAAEKYRYEMLFMPKEGEELPAVGDSVRFTPGVATDLGGAHPHLNNPWVRIVGDLSTKIQATSLIAVDPGATYPEGSPAVQPILVDKEMSIDDIIEKYGVHGHVIDFDMSSLLQNLQAEGDSTATPESIRLEYETHYFSSLGHFINSKSGTILCSDQVFEGNCLINPGNIFLAWNMRSNEGRLVGAGVYIARIEIKIKSKKRVVSRKAKDYMWGIQRVKNGGKLLE
jgi:fibro-slime domain-containing protein